MTQRNIYTEDGEVNSKDFMEFFGDVDKTLKAGSLNRLCGNTVVIATYREDIKRVVYTTAA